MKLKDYQLIGQIGAGTFASVYKAKDKQGNIFAIKKMKEMPRNDENVVMNQINLLKSINHKNIIHFQKDFKENGKWYLVFEYCGKGDLQRYKNKQGKQFGMLGNIPQAFTKNIFYNIVEAVCVLHQKNIVHRDLKLANILINDDFEIKLADFGFSKDSQSQLMTSFCGTPLTMAPQILQREPYDKRCDTWSLGVLLYQLIYGQPPFYPSKQYGAGIIGLINAVLKATPIFHQGVHISDECKDIILKCLEKNVSKRPTAQQLKTHKWFISGIKSRIRREYLQESMVDYTDAADRAKSILSQSITENLKTLIQQMLLTDSGIKQNLKLLCKYYPQNEKLQMLYLLKVTQSLCQLSQSYFVVRIQQQEYKVPMKQINKLSTHMENLKEFLRVQGKKRQIPKKINLDRQLVRFVVRQFQKCLDRDQKQSQIIKLLYEISKLCLNKVQYVHLVINWAYPQEDQIMKKIFISYLKKLTYQDIIHHINDQHYEKQDASKNWLVQTNIVNKSSQAIEYVLGGIIKKIMEINSNSLKGVKI